MKKWIIIAFIVVATLVVAQRRSSSLHRIPSPTKIEGWLNVNGDVWPVIPDKWDLGKPANWWDSAFVAYPELRSLLVWSADTTDSASMSPTKLVIDSVISGYFSTPVAIADTTYTNWLAVKDSSSITVVSPIIFNDTLTSANVLYLSVPKITTGGLLQVLDITEATYVWLSALRVNNNSYFGGAVVDSGVHSFLDSTYFIAAAEFDSVVTFNEDVWHLNQKKSYWTDGTPGADTSYIDQNGSFFRFYSDNNMYIMAFLELTKGLIGRGDTYKIQWEGNQWYNDNNANADTVFYYAHGTDGLLRYITASDQWEFADPIAFLDSTYFIGAAEFDSVVTFNDSTHFADVVTHAGAVTIDDGNLHVVDGQKIFITDGSLADSLEFRVDATIAVIDSDNLLYFRIAGANYLVLGNSKAEASLNFSVLGETYLGDASTDKVKILGDSIIYLTGACSTYWYQTADSSIIESNKPMRLGSGSIILSGDSCWTTDIYYKSGGGLSFGELGVYNNVGELPIGFVSTKVQYDSFNTDGLSNNTTPDEANEQLTIDHAGIYLVTVSIHASSVAGAGALFAFDIYKNNGATHLTNLHAHRNFVGGGGDVASVSISGLVALSASDDLELWVTNETNAQNIILNDVTLSVVQVGN